MSENDTTPTRPTRPTRTPQDRKRPAARAPRPATAAPADVMQSEDWIPATICGETVYVAPIGQWRMSANEALIQGRLNKWAVSVMSADDADLWLSLDPTNAEVQAFFAEWTETMSAVATPSDRAALNSFLSRR